MRLIRFGVFGGADRFDGGDLRRGPGESGVGGEGHGVLDPGKQVGGLGDLGDHLVDGRQLAGRQYFPFLGTIPG